MVDAYRFAAVATSEALREKLAHCNARSPETAVYRAVLAQYDGDVEGAIRILRHLIRGLPEGDRAPGADLLAPMLVMRHENLEVERLADLIESEGWPAAASSFRAIVASDRGNRAAALQHFDLAEQRLSDEKDELIRSRVLHRLARAAYQLDDYVRATDLALSSAKLCCGLEAWRGAAANYSIIYNIHHNVTGDIDEADHYVRLWHAASLKTMDESFVHAALVAEYQMAVQMGDDLRVAELLADIRNRLLPQQYREGFALSFSHAVLRGSSDLAGMCTLFQIVRDSPNRSRGEWALCSALLAVGEAGLLNDVGARENIRLASSRLGRPKLSDSPLERRIRRLARVSIAAACFLIGDTVKGRRALAAREALSGNEHHLLGLLESRSLDQAPRSATGIARVLATAQRNRLSHEPPAGLTAAEHEVLQLLGRGWGAGRIAIETGRSVNTVYNHTRAILSKLDVSRSAEAVAVARERGILT